MVISENSDVDVSGDKGKPSLQVVRMPQPQLPEMERWNSVLQAGWAGDLEVGQRQGH